MVAVVDVVDQVAEQPSNLSHSLAAPNSHYTATYSYLRSISGDICVTNSHNWAHAAVTCAVLGILHSRGLAACGAVPPNRGDRPKGGILNRGCGAAVRAGRVALFFPACPVPQGMAGLFFGAVSAHRVVVFIDYQNVYHLARAAFGFEGDPDKNLGHVHPRRVGELLCDLGRSAFDDRELSGVRVYQGLPDIRSGAGLVRFATRQIAGWERSAGVVVKTRPLAYHETTRRGKTAWRAQEKGVDVMLAVDVVDMARTDAYDTAVVFSADTDYLAAS